MCLVWISLQNTNSKLLSQKSSPSCILGILVNVDLKITIAAREHAQDYSRYFWPTQHQHCADVQLRAATGLCGH